MKWMRGGAVVLLAAVFLASLGAGWLAPAGYARQHRDRLGAPPSHAFLLGTDELGRDALARLLYGSRVSLSLAPAAAGLATLIAAIAGISAGYCGGWLESCVMRVIDLVLAVPWMFLLLTVRALLPLNVPPAGSVGITFLLLGLLGWAGPARVVRSAARELKRKDFMFQAYARGCHPLRVLTRHMLPALRPILAAQFWMSVPVFILSEANLGFLGLGVAEPLPSWGNLLASLQNLETVASSPWRLAPLVLLVVVMVCLHVVVSKEDYSR